MKQLAGVVQFAMPAFRFEGEVMDLRKVGKIVIAVAKGIAWVVEQIIKGK